MSKQLILIIAAIVLVLAIAGVIIFFRWQGETGKIGEPAVKEPGGLGGELFEKSVPQGNLSVEVPSLPQSNPFGEVETNPFKYTNPFE